MIKPTRRFLPLAPLFLLFLGSCRSSIRQPAIPANAYDFPDTHGVYILDGGVFTPIYSNFLGKTAQEQLRHRTFSKDVSILIFDQSLIDPKSGAALVSILDWRDLGEQPMTHVAATTRPVANHLDMVMITPTQPLEAGLYSVGIQVKGGPDYQFGVETPDLVAYWKQVLEENPNSWQAHNHLGAALYMQGDVNGSYPHFAKAVELNPENPESHNNLGLALAAQGKTAEAIREYEAAVKIDDDSAMDTNLANSYLQVKRYDDAINTYRHAIELNPDNASAHCNLGYALMQEGKVDDAIPEFKKAMELDPNMTQAQGDLKQALSMKPSKQ